MLPGIPWAGTTSETKPLPAEAPRAFGHLSTPPSLVGDGLGLSLGVFFTSLRHLCHGTKSWRDMMGLKGADASQTPPYVRTDSRSLPGNRRCIDPAVSVDR